MDVDDEERMTMLLRTLSTSCMHAAMIIALRLDFDIRPAEWSDDDP